MRDGEAGTDWSLVWDAVHDLGPLFALGGMFLVILCAGLIQKTCVAVGWDACAEMICEQCQ